MPSKKLNGKQISSKDYYIQLKRSGSVSVRDVRPASTSTNMKGQVALYGYSYSSSEFPKTGVQHAYFSQSPWSSGLFTPVLPLSNRYTSNCGIPACVITKTPQLTADEYPEEVMQLVDQKGKLLSDSIWQDLPTEECASHMLIHLEVGMEEDHINAQILLREFATRYELIEIYKGVYVGLRKDAPNTDVGFFYVD